MIKYFLILILLLSSCNKQDRTGSIKSTEATENLVNKIYIRYQDLDIETPIRIECDSFESYFQGNLENIEIGDQDKINKILLLLKKCSANEKYNTFNIDVRYKMNLYYSDNHIEHVCGNALLINIKGNIYKVEDNLLKLINSLSKK